MQRGGVRRLPGQVDGAPARVVRRGDGRLPARHLDQSEVSTESRDHGGPIPAHLAQRDHVVALVALPAQPHAVDRGYLEAVHAEGVEALHAVHRAVLPRGHRARVRPVRLLALPNLT